ncbi:MAG: hypothetical protein D6760_08625 [Deltaproteobacteria bacterium]|nr:MAG: hypothetical protein D6760_08625 [Deltaproteobacteria bacterium]
MEPPHRRAWLERPRGHAKTSDLAVMAVWAVAFAPRPLSGVAAAADRDQARLLRDAIARLARLNDWLAATLDVQSYRIVNSRTGSTLEILSSDAPTSYGLTPDFVVADELVHWQSRDLWDSLLSASAKRRHCVLVVITNAGFLDTWQFKTREAIRSDPRWFFSRLDGPTASWITADRLAEQRRLLPDIAYRRLWKNDWTAGTGDALAAADIDAAVTLAGPMRSAEPAYVYVAGLDLGLKRDASALCVLAIHHGETARVPTGRVVWGDWGPEPEYRIETRQATARIRLASTQLWKPPARGKIDLTAVERAVAEAHERFGFQAVAYDPWQAEHLAQRLHRAGLPMRETPFSGVNLQRMATAMLEAFSDRRIELYRDDDLLRDLRRLRVVERHYGWRLASPRDGDGHGDLATAFALALLAADEARPKRRIAAWLDAGCLGTPSTTVETPSVGDLFPSLANEGITPTHWPMLDRLMR